LSGDDNSESTKIVSITNLQSPQKKNYACLIIIAGSNVGQMFRIDSEEMVIGRGHLNQIVLIDDGISRSHCRLIALPGGEVMLEDLSSTNGTYINSERVSRRLLRDGDKIQVGSTSILKFTYHDNIEENFQRQMFESALRDGLTKTYNKRYFVERLEAEFAYALRHHFPVTLFMFDLDHFKRFNDTYGHLCGDAVLVEMARRVTGSIRSEDVFARYGGEEFALITRGIPHENALILADRLRMNIANRPFLYEGQQLTVTVSLGIASLPSPLINSPQELVEAADRALYQAKHSGRNRVCSFNQ
jgi:two-component system, cell cycle response regulator